MFTWSSVLGVHGAAGGEGDARRVVLFVLLPAAVEQQQSEQQHHEDDEHHDAADRPPRLPLAGRKRNHDAARPLGRVWGTGGILNTKCLISSQLSEANVSMSDRALAVCVCTLFTVLVSTFTDAVSGESVTDEDVGTRAGLSAEGSEPTGTAGWKTEAWGNVHAWDVWCKDLKTCSTCRKLIREKLCGN